MKRWFEQTGSFFAVASGALLLPMCMAAAAWGQGLEEPEKPEASWVLSYVLVVLCVGLGLFAVCRTGRRQK